MPIGRVWEYLLEVKSHLHLGEEEERSIVSELYSHIVERSSEFDRTMPVERRYEFAIRDMGRPRVIARMFYEAHTAGSLKDAVLTGLPYLLVSVLFGTHTWRNPVLAPAVFASIVVTTLYGWWSGKPNWLYSWAGFSLFPLLVAGLTLTDPVVQAANSLVSGAPRLPDLLPGGTVLVFYGLALWLLVSTTIRVARRDWLLASFMLLPLPVLGLWLFRLECIGGCFQPVSSHLFWWDAPMSVLTAVLAVSLATFVRLRQRRYRLISFLLIGSNAIAFVTHSIWRQLRFASIMLIVLTLLLCLLSPAFAGKPAAQHGREIRRWITEIDIS